MSTKKRKRGALYFTSIARLDRDAVVLTGQYYALENSDERRTAILSLSRGVWGGIDVSGIAHAIGCNGRPPDPNRETLVLERNRGLYRVKPGGSVKFERIDTQRSGFLMDLRQIAGTWYAVGAHHQVYRQSGRSWKPVDGDIYVPGDAGEARMLLSISGTSAGNLYAVGFNGIVLNYDGKRWRTLDLPTNVGFQRVLCLSKDEVYVCGYANSLYRGSLNNWESLTEPDDKVIYWDMAYFKGKVYVCTKQKLFAIEGARLREVDIPIKGPLAFYRMDSDENELWTCGNECLLKFDGRKWVQYEFPDNV